MRDFFIRWTERIINVVVVLGALLVLIAAISVVPNPQGGLMAAIGVLVIGSLYLIVMAGMVYLGLGIYANTRRTAEAVEELLRRQS